MEIIPMSDLKVGDIFAYEIKVKGREAFHVVEKTDEKIKCYSRNDHMKKIKSKSIEGYVYFLRHEKT